MRFDQRFGNFSRIFSVSKCSIIYVAGIAEQSTVLSGHEGTIRALLFHPDGRRLYSSGADETIRVWEKVDAHMGKEVRLLRPPENKLVISAEDLYEPNADTSWTCTDILRPPGLYRGLNIYDASGINLETSAALYALGAVELPPNDTVGDIPHNSPFPLTALYGRDEGCVTLVAKLLDPDTRLLTIWGEGGVGKTRMAIEVAHMIIAPTAPPFSSQGVPIIHKSVFTDGVWLIQLANISVGREQIEHQIEQVAAAIGNVLNLSFSHDQPLAQPCHGSIYDGASFGHCRWRPVSRKTAGE